MRVSLVITVSRVLTWGCVILLAVLSLWPGKGLGFLFVLPELNTMRTGLPGPLEHLVAYAGSAAIGMAGYGPSRGGVRVIGGFWVYAAVNRRHTSSGDLASLMTACEDEELRGARQGDGSAAHQRDGRTVDDPDLKDGLPEKSGNGCPVTVVRENNRFPREPDLDDRRRSRLKLPHCRQLPDAPLIGAAGMKPYRLLAHETFPLRLTAKPVSAITPLPNNGR